MKINHRIIKELIRIRIVEQSFLDLFSEGKLNGTVHTCIGQELSAVSFAIPKEIIKNEIDPESIIEKFNNNKLEDLNKSVLSNQKNIRLMKYLILIFLTIGVIIFSQI